MTDGSDSDGTGERDEDAAGGRVGDDGTVAGLNRRDLLAAGGFAAAFAAAGVGYLATRRDGGPVPERHHWEPAEAPLETPWFGDVDPTDPRPEYPRPQLIRERWRSLNGVWGFEPAGDGDLVPEDRRLAEGILVPFPVESALSGVAGEEDHVWYRRTFEIPRDWDVRDVEEWTEATRGGGTEGGTPDRRATEELLLHFEAVDYETTVYVNGEEVGTHVGGYDHFAFEVSDALTEARRQELVVEVRDPTEQGQALGKQLPADGGIWYTPTTGIWQSVWMEPVPRTRVDGLDVTPDLDGEALRLSVETAGATGATDGPGGTGLAVAATALADGEAVASATGPADETLELSIPDPRPWSPADPYLYDLEVELRREGEVVDAVESYFGMRSIGLERVGPDVRTTLNGEPHFALGTLDQGFWPDGIYAAPTDEALAFDLETHAELGFNAVRKHVKVEPRRWYYHADRLGLVVHQDMPSTAGGSSTGLDGPPDRAGREQFERELRRVIDQLGNHPSIALWVPFNEGWGSYDQERIAAQVAEWDPERLVTANSGSNVAGGDCGCGDVVDHHNYPGPGGAPPAAERASVLGEFGGLGLAVDDHGWGTGDDYAYATYVTSAGLSAAYVDSLERIGRLVGSCGLSAAIYTQLTDVENENNGLLTYDRQVVKPAARLVREANESVLETASAYEPPSPTEGTGDLTGVGYWPFDDGDGGVARDPVGGNDGELVGEPTWVDGRVGGALSFDAAFVDTGEAVLDTSGPYSVAAWVSLADPSAIKTAVSQGGDNFSAFALEYVEVEDGFAFTARDADAGGTAVRALAAEPPETDRWYHLVGVRDAYDRTVRLYVDGRRVDETPFCPGFRADRALVVGSGMRDGLLSTYWEGAIDEVRVFDRALGDDEVATLYGRF